MKKTMIALTLAATMVLATGCDVEGRQFIIDLALSWAAENAVSIGSYTLFGRSGNAEVDAVMGARDVISNINEADRLMEEGREQNDLSKMEAAIKRRPGDYTYRVSYGAALLKDGNADEAEAQFEAADNAVQDYSTDHAQSYAIQGIDELGALRPEFEKTGFSSVQQCQAYYGRMAYFYEIRMVTGEAFFEQQRDHYIALKGSCR
jgi:hypothetical protein